jgi:hypothetical protein
MKKSISTQQQKDYWLRKTEDGKHYIRIRMNHKEIERETDEGIETMWQCDEVEVMMPQRADIEQYVKNHHKALFYFAEPELLVEKLSELLGE